VSEHRLARFIPEVMEMLDLSAIEAPRRIL
jgi:hypothetical protein